MGNSLNRVANKREYSQNNRKAGHTGTAHATSIHRREPARGKRSCFGPVTTESGKPSLSGLAASLAELADAIARAQHGEWVTIASLGVATVPSEDVGAIGSPSDDDAEDGMIELDR